MLRLKQQSKTLPRATAPVNPQPFYQERGFRYSRALPYEFM